MLSFKPGRGRLFGLATGILLAFPLLSTHAFAGPGYAYGTLHSFGDGSVPVDGTPSINSLIQGPNGNLYGVTAADTAGNNGVIFKVAPDGSGYTILHNFADGSIANDGQHPYGKLVVGPDGNLWGTTAIGGIADGGTVFKIALDGSGYTIMHQFGDGSVSNDGIEPIDSLIVGSDGNFYGTTTYGGDDSVGSFTAAGTIFKITPTGIVTIVHSFPANVGPTSGNYPNVGVIQGQDGTLYGTTGNAGAADQGIIYKINPDGTGYTILHDFAQVKPDGADSHGRLLLSSDGKLCGTTAVGGQYGGGVLFRLNTDGSEYTLLHQFGAGDDGGYPYCTLTVGPDGSLYGATAAGGVSNIGTIFKITSAGEYSTVYDLDGTPGIYPETDLLLASDGNFYGMTEEGGSAGRGTIFRFSPIASLNVSTPASVTAGVPFNATVTARNFNNNAVTDYSGTVHFTSNDPTAVLPADTLVNGTGTIPVTLYSAATKTIRVRDTSNTALTGTATVPVNAAAATHFTLTAPTTATAGTAFYSTLSALDAYNNVVKSFTDTIHLSSTDTAAVLPTNFVLTGGAKQIIIKLQMPGTQTITATDTNNSLAVTSGSINVGTLATKYLITGPATSTVGALNTYTITAKDTVGNTATGYTGTVHFTTTDPNAAVPGDTTLVNGTGTFQVTFNTKGAQKVNATDTVNAATKGLAATTVR